MRKLFAFMLASVLCYPLITPGAQAKPGGSPNLGEPGVRIPAMRHTGKIKWFNKRRGFGFIARDDGAPDIYFHVSGLTKGVDPDKLAEGVKVEFDVVSNNRGEAVAKNITIIE